MNEKKFFALYEGKLSTWNRELKNGDIDSENYIAVYYLLNQEQGSVPTSINYHDKDKMIGLQLELGAILSMKPTENTVIIYSDTFEIPFTVFEVTINPNYSFHIAVLEKQLTHYTFLEKLSSNVNALTDDFLMNLIKDYENNPLRILCSSSLPPCN